MGRFKWEKLKMDYQLETTQPPSRDSVYEAIARFRAVGLKAFQRKKTPPAALGGSLLKQFTRRKK